MVVEGVVEKIFSERQGRKSLCRSPARCRAFRSQPLNLRDLEQGLDQINRLSSRPRDARHLEPGSWRRARAIVIRNFRANWAFHFGATVDSMGTDSTGETKAGLTTALSTKSAAPQRFPEPSTYRQGLPGRALQRRSLEFAGRRQLSIYSIPLRATTASAGLQSLRPPHAREHRHAAEWHRRGD